MLALLLTATVVQANDTTAAWESLMFSRINAARENPLAMAASIGMNPDEVAASLPDMAGILTGGLPPPPVRRPPGKRRDRTRERHAGPQLL